MDTINTIQISTKVATPIKLVHHMPQEHPLQMAVQLTPYTLSKHIYKELSHEGKNNPCSVIMKVWNFIRVRGESNEVYVKILDKIFYLPDNGLSNSQILCLQANLPSLWRIIAGLTDNTGFVFFVFNSHIPYFINLKIKINYLVNHNYFRQIIGRSNMRRIYLPPKYIITLLRGLTEGQNEGKLYYAQLWSAAKQSKYIIGSLLHFYD